MIPFDARVRAAQTPQEFIDHVLVERARAPRTSRSGRTSASATGARATPTLLARRRALRDPRRRRWSRSTARSSPRRHIRGLIAAGEVERGRALPRRPVPAARRRSSHGDKRGRSSASRPPTSCPTRRLVCPGHGVYACRAASTGGVPAAVNVGVRPTFGTGRGRARRGLPARLRRRPLRHASCGSTSSRACAASGASRPSRRWSSRCTRRRGPGGWPRPATVTRRHDASPLSASRSSSPSSARPPATPARPRSRSRCSPSASTSSPSTCAPTARTTTRAAAC